MKKIKNFKVLSRITLLLMAAVLIFSCNKETSSNFDIQASVNHEEVNNQPELFEIPKRFNKNPEEYVASQLDLQEDYRDVSGPDCIFIDDNGVAHILDGCWVNNDLPDYGCDIVARGISDCYPLANGDCSVCKVWVVLDCDGKLYWYRTWFLLC